MSQLLMRRPSLADLPGMPLIEPGYVLRTFVDDDLEGIATLLGRAYRDDAWSPERVRAELTEAPDVRKVFIVSHGDQPVAIAGARLDTERFPESGYIHWLAADPDHSGKRLGYIVALAALRECAALRCQDAVIEAEDDQQTALFVCRQLGFMPTSVQENSGLLHNQVG